MDKYDSLWTWAAKRQPLLPCLSSSGTRQWPAILVTKQSNDKKDDTVVSMDELVTMMQSMKLQDLIWSRELDAAEEDLMQLRT
jgi:hypothetical protein